MELLNTTDAINALGALAHDTRLAIFRLLVRTGPQGLAVGKISAHVQVPPATLSFHLSHLQQARLIGATRNGRQIIYSANYGLMGQLMAFLTENCCEDNGDKSCCDIDLGEVTSCQN